MSLASYQTALLRDVIVAEEEGFEPPLGCPTAGFQDRSLQPDLGIPPINAYHCSSIKFIYGGPGRTRTYDQPVMSRWL